MSVPQAHAPIAVHGDAALGSRRWTAFACAAFVLLVFACFWPTTASLMQRWEDAVHRTYTHGYLILALSLWLIWRDRSRLAPARAYFPALTLVAAGVVLWLVALRAGLQIVQQGLLPLLALATILTGCGWAVARQLLLPVLYLYCAIPVWDVLNPLLQWISVFAVRALLRIADVPAYFEDNRFQIPAGSFEIAEGCSGLHFFVVAFSIAVLYGAVHRDPLRTRIKLLALALVLAMLTNWFRIFIIVLAGYFSDMQHRLVREEHYSFGWFMFAGAMLLYFLIVRRWPVAAADREPHSARLAEGGASVFKGWAAAVLGLAVGPLWSVLDRNRAADVEEHGLRLDPPGWRAQKPASSWRPEFQGADAEQHYEYSSGQALVEAFVATYLWQEQGKEIAGYGASPIGGLRVVRGAAGGASAPAPWRSTLTEDPSGAHWLVFYAQRIDDQWRSSAILAKLDYGFRSLFDAPLSSMIVLRSRCLPDCNNARSSLQHFISAAFPQENDDG